MASKRILTCLQCSHVADIGYWRPLCPKCGHNEADVEIKHVDIADLPEAKARDFVPVALVRKVQHGTHKAV